MRAPRAADPLPAAVRQLFLEAPGAGVPPDAAAAHWRHGRAGSIANAAVVEVWLRLDEHSQVVALRYRVWGCPHTIAVLGWLAQCWPGRPAAAPPEGGPPGWQAALGVPVEKLGRLLIIEDALRAALGAPGQAAGA